MSEIKLYNDDCFNIFPQIADKSVDMICCDLPYGTTDCKWDNVLPFDKLWNEYKRIISDIGAIVLFGSEPFSTMLRYNGIDLYKYDWVWYKSMPTGFVNAKNKPLKDFENIMVFSKGTTTHKGKSSKRMIYNPQGLIDCDIQKSNDKKFGSIVGEWNHLDTYKQTQTNYPRMVLTNFVLDNERFHPTQKPVALLEYLIKTYTNEGMLVLDNCMGSGTCGVACKKLNRNFIGIEKEKEYFDIAKKRIENTVVQLDLFGDKK